MTDRLSAARATRRWRKTARQGLLEKSHDGVLSRRELAHLGWDSHAIDREVEAGRWRCPGRLTVALHTAPLSFEAECWRAVFEVGEGIALVDGVSSLQVAGLKHFEEPFIHVSVPHTAKVPDVGGVVIHKIRHRHDFELWSRSGLPRTVPPVAAIRAAHWAVSERQAATVLMMGGQQRLYSPAWLAETRIVVRGRNRRKFIDDIIRAVEDGIQALGEFDITELCRRRGLPPPTHQIQRRGPNGRIYLDIGWEDIGLFLEIDGAGHTWGVNTSHDHLRANAVTLQKGTVLRMDIIGVRLMGEEFMDQVCAAHALLTARRKGAVA